MYDSGTHVPLLIRWPGMVAPKQVENRLVSLLDLGPTLLSLADIEVPEHLQGEAFLGEHAREPRKFVYGIRDRMDETVDMLRSVRDHRFKYIRNYMPELPYAQPIAYMDLMPKLQEWRRLAGEDKLVGPQKLFFAPSKPSEELYDIVSDPHEIVNLAGDPRHERELKRLRAEHKEWCEKTGDIGLKPEAEVMEQVRPDGKWSVTADPIIAIAGDVVTITCATKGASIAYTLGEKDKAGREHWLLYHQPIKLPADAKLRALACRLGFKDSAEVQ